MNDMAAAVENSKMELVGIGEPLIDDEYEELRIKFQVEFETPARRKLAYKEKMNELKFNVTKTCEDLGYSFNIEMDTEINEERKVNDINYYVVTIDVYALKD